MALPNIVAAVPNRVVFRNECRFICLLLNMFGADVVSLFLDFTLPIQIKGSTLVSEIYIARLVTQEYTNSIKMALLK